MKLEKINDKIAFMESTFTKRVLFSEDRVLSFVLNLMPGQEIPPHNHEESDLIFYVLSGGVELEVDGKITQLVEGDVVYCRGEEMFGLKNNTDKNNSNFVVLAPRPGMKLYAKEFGGE